MLSGCTITPKAKIKFVFNFFITGLQAPLWLGYSQGMYKNRVKNDRIFLKFPYFYLANEEIQQKTEWENSKCTYYFDFPTLDFLIRQIKEQEFQNIFCHYLPYFYTYPGAPLQILFLKKH